jgi:hypothetical protein
MLLKYAIMKKYFFVPVAAFVLFSCTGKPYEVGEVDTWVPVYSSKAEAEKIIQLTPQPIVNGGKIATLGNYVFQVETGKGIHITDYSNTTAPVKKSFISIAQCQELTLKGNYLYTNNMADLVVLDLSTTTAIKLTSRVVNAFPDLAIQYPPASRAYFVCADASKGQVIGWELKKIKNPKCKTP